MRKGKRRQGWGQRHAEYGGRPPSSARSVASASAEASDSIRMNTAGIPTYGITGLFTDPDGGHIHGLNERIRVKSVYEGRTFLYRLVKLYADQ